MHPPTSNLFLNAAALARLADHVVLRDPSGRSGRPHLVPGVCDGDQGLWAVGSFLVLQRFKVSKRDGIRFCEATGDTNSIHLEGDVVPGAYTAAKILLALEVVCPGLVLSQCTMKFTAAATYEQPLFTKVRCEPGSDGTTRFVATTSHEGVAIATLDVVARRGCLTEDECSPARKRVDRQQLRSVRTFMAALGVAPVTWFGARGSRGYFYPRAFLAALPSGEMVRKLRGEGGVLNKLTLEFDPSERIPMLVGALPEVEVQEPKRSRRTFNRIVTAITQSVRTVVRGSALVLKRDPSRSLEPLKLTQGPMQGNELAESALCPDADL